MLKEIMLKNDTKCQITSNNIRDIMDNPNGYGLNEDSIMMISDIKSLMKKYLSTKLKYENVLSEPDEVVNFVKLNISNADYEVFFILFLNTKNQLLHYQRHAVGTIDQAIIYPRRIIKDCLKYNAASIILCHNHPSGSMTPSPEDKRLTTELKQALKIMDVNLLDHIIVGGGDYYSFQEENIL